VHYSLEQEAAQLRERLAQSEQHGYGGDEGALAEAALQQLN
tara:strand:- start:574 stop:696 length:123 start_codon:yes stop_codon:yes gene_type:complete